MRSKYKILLALLVIGFGALTFFHLNQEANIEGEEKVKEAILPKSRNLQNEIAKLIPSRSKKEKEVSLGLKENLNKRQVLLSSTSKSGLLRKKKDYQKIQSEIKKHKLAQSIPLQMIDNIELEFAIVLSSYYDAAILDSIRYAQEEKELTSYEWSLLNNFSKTNDFLLLVKSGELSREAVSPKALRRIYGSYQKSDTGNSKQIPASVVEDQYDED